MNFIGKILFHFHWCRSLALHGMEFRGLFDLHRKIKNSHHNQSSMLHVIESIIQNPDYKVFNLKRFSINSSMICHSTRVFGMSTLTRVQLTSRCHKTTHLSTKFELRRIPSIICRSMIVEEEK